MIKKGERIKETEILVRCYNMDDLFKNQSAHHDYFYFYKGNAAAK